MDKIQMIAGRDIVVIGIQPWDIKIGSNCKNIATEFSKSNRVLYVNPPLDRKTKLTHKSSPEVKKRLRIAAGIDDPLVQIHENLWNFYPSSVIESINWLPHFSLYEFLNRRNNRLFIDDIKSGIERLGFTDLILFNDSLMFTGFYSRELLNPKVSLYYIRDDLTKQPYFARHGKYLEPLLARKYDAVVSNSIYLANYMKSHNPNSHMVGQGCDLEVFDPAANYPLPLDLMGIKRPIVGYVGFLTTIRLDIDLLEFLASANQDISIVLVGPEDEFFKNSKLHSFENLHFLGGKKEVDLPGYIHHFDVAINPQAVNDMTIGNYPRKIDEYLAMGKPVVATGTETMAYFKEVVLLSTSKEEFSENIRLALRDDNQGKVDKRIKIANEHTWERNVEKIYEVIERLI
ncbi:MAG: glycosyltransferase [Cyclobacteriaceae bacterium]